MTYFNLGEIQVVWQFVPTVVFLTGLIVLWTRTVWFKAADFDTSTSTSSPEILFGQRFVDIKRFGYYFNARLFEPKSPTVIIKSNLLWLIALTFALELVCNYLVWGNGEGGSYFNGMLAYSPLVVVTKLLTLAFMWMAVLYVDAYEPGVFASTLMLIGSVLFFMLVLVAANNIIVLYVALEGMSLLLFVLTAQSKTIVSVESGLKYFFQSSFASVLLLLGIAFVYSSTLSFNFDEIRVALDAEPITLTTTVGFFLITTALLFKVAAFPGHYWAPDVYRGPTASVLTVFAVVVKLAAFLVLLRVFAHFRTAVHVQFSWLLYVSSAASMLIGALGAIRVINESGSRRQFVAYTSINQVGFVRLGLVCVSLEGFWASFIYRIVYLLASVVFLGIISRIRIYGVDSKVRNLTRLSDFRRLFNDSNKFSRRTDLLALAYAVWSMAGLPPLAGFFGKVGLWASLLRKMGDLASGASWVEVAHAFPYVDATYEFDPFMMLGSILILSIVVSIISGVYYFKLYELMSPSASNAEIASNLNKVEAVGVAHDRSTLALTIVLLVAMLSWFGLVCWTGVESPWTFPATLFDSMWNSWATEFDGYVL